MSSTNGGPVVENTARIVYGPFVRTTGSPQFTPKAAPSSVMARSRSRTTIPAWKKGFTLLSPVTDASEIAPLAAAGVDLMQLRLVTAWVVDKQPLTLVAPDPPTRHSQPVGLGP